MAVSYAESTAARIQRRSRGMYILAAVLALAIALAGFWATYFGPLTTGALDAPNVIHLHAAVFVGWIVLVITQASLAAMGRRALHVRLGNIGMLYGAGLVCVGLLTAFTLFAERIANGQIREAQNQLFVPLTDIAVFTPFLAAAWIQRHKPEIHKRLIIVATTILLIAAVHRMPYFATKPPHPSIVLLLWLAPIYISMAHDFLKHRIVHPAYLIGIAAIVYLKFFRVPLFKSDAWRSTAEWLTQFFV